MTCARCLGGFVALIYDELRCINCGHRPKPLRPHEVKELRALETVTVMHPTIPRCHRCAHPAETGMRLCEKHRKLNALYVQQAKKRKMVSTSFLTRTVSHVTQNTQGV